MLIEHYNQSVLNAVRDVAINGTRLQTLNEERELQLERVDAALAKAPPKPHLIVSR